MNNWTTENWREIVSAAPEGIVICDATAPDYPVVYANAAFAQLCGYPVTALLGTNLRILQGTDRDQECRHRMREALERRESCRVLVRNYRPDGSQFWNEMLIQPMKDASGKVAHWVAFCRDASERLKSSDRGPQGLPGWMREDRLTGLHSRAYFEELLRRDWQVAQRDSHEIGLTLFDIDDLTAYNAAFDKVAGDACIRRVARVITASYRRGSDFVGRWDGGTFAVLTQGDATEKATEYAGTVAQRVRELLIHHPRAGHGRFVSLSAGVASLVPPRELALEAIIHACQTALKRAKSRGKNSVAAAESADFELPKADKK
jgi:diguanylate cyclase (GGDEF)-like protein/PAS domain S-box-containing protein